MPMPGPRLTRALAPAVGALIALASCATGRSSPATFSTPEEAIAQLVAALRSDDVPRIERILGPESEDLVRTGEGSADRAARDSFLRLFDERHRLESTTEGSATLYLGADEWPMPIPIVRNSVRWRFDCAAGREELLRRSVGANELDAIQVCLACIDAQREYFAADRDGDGILEYAQRLGSSPGARDGLHWTSGDGEPWSPLGPLAAAAEAGRDPAPGAGDAREPYCGYFYRILTAQGPHAPGGAYEYRARDEMIGGCALVAWPAEYGVTGVMTFIVSLEGRLFEKDLGEETDEIAASMQLFDPDDSWRASGEDRPEAAAR